MFGPVSIACQLLLYFKECAPHAALPLLLFIKTYFQDDSFWDVSCLKYEANWRNLIKYSKQVQFESVSSSLIMSWNGQYGFGCQIAKWLCARDIASQSEAKRSDRVNKRRAHHPRTKKMLS